jgi:hypothetical protein
MPKRKIGGRFDVAYRRHTWRKGEKSLFARRNDLRSIEATLQAARNRDVVDPAEVERYEVMLDEMVERMRAVQEEYGFEPGHEFEADSVIARDRQLIEDHLTGNSIVALAASLEAARRQAGVTFVDDSGKRVPRYPKAASEVDRLTQLIKRRL